MHIVSAFDGYGLEIAREDKVDSLRRAIRWATFIALKSNGGKIPGDEKAIQDIAKNVRAVQARAVELGWLSVIHGCLCSQCEPREYH